MFEDGVYLSHGAQGHVLVIVREDGGATLWVRDFASVETALGLICDDILVEHERSAVASRLSGGRGFYTAEYEEPEDGFGACSFKKYALASS
jgi:hypothetical protein